MTIFFESLKQQLANRGYHAPVDCPHHIAPRDRRDEVRCPKCSVLMCGEDDMPTILRQAIVNALLASNVEAVLDGCFNEWHDYAVCRLEDVIDENKGLRAANTKLRSHSMKMATELKEVSATLEQVVSLARRIDAKVCVVTNPTGRSIVEDHFMASQSEAHEAAFDSFGQPSIQPPCGHLDQPLVDSRLEAVRKNLVARVEDRDALFTRREAEYYDRNFIYPRRLDNGNYAKRTKEESERATVVAMKMNLSIDRFVAYYGLDVDAVSFIDNSSFLDFLIRMYRLFKIHYDIDLENVEPHIIKAVIDQERQFIRVARHSSALGRAKSRMSDLHRLYEMIVGRRRK